MASPFARRVAIGILTVAVVGAIFLAAVPTLVEENESPEESVEGTARAPIVGLRLVGRMPLQVPNADVWVHEQYAYVGTWSSPCPGAGVKVVDVRDPTLPRQVGALALYGNTSAEDVVVAAVDTPRFKGDLLAVGLQACNPAGFSGVDLWDVSDPVRPVHLSFFFTGPGGVHELSLVQRPSDGRVLALLAVPHAEVGGQGGDFKLVDVTDPYLPFLASDWGIIRQRGHAPGSGTGAMPTEYDHGALPSPDGLTAYLSYWDAGVHILDITVPEQPRYLGRTWYPPGAEGNAHSVAVAPERDLLIQADEDFDYRTSAARILAPESMVGLVTLVEATFGPRVTAENKVNATLVDAGRACANDTLPANLMGAVALVERGDCLFTEKVMKAQTAGALAVLVGNNVPGPASQMSGEDANVTIPAFMIAQDAAARLRQANASNVTVTVELSPEHAEYNPWGGLRFFDISDPARPRPVGEYVTQHTRNQPPGPEGGRYSVHNPVWLPGDDMVVASWFGDGVRVIHVDGDLPPHEIASWVPPSDASPVQPPDVWGVYVDGDHVYASDMQYGLWVLEFVRAE